MCASESYTLSYQYQPLDDTHSLVLGFVFVRNRVILPRVSTITCSTSRERKKPRRCATHMNTALKHSRMMARAIMSVKDQDQ